MRIDLSDQRRRRAPEDDRISRRRQGRRDGYALSGSQLIDKCMLIFADGVENVESGLATAVATFLQHPDQLDRMMRRPELVENAVEEVIRHQPPAQFIGRIALEQIPHDRTPQGNLRGAGGGDGGLGCRMGRVSAGLPLQRPRTKDSGAAIRGAPSGSPTPTLGHHRMVH